MSTTILDSGVAEKLELSLYEPLHCCRLLCLYGPLQLHMVPFASCGPLSPIKGVSLSHRAFHLRGALDWGFKGGLCRLCNRLAKTKAKQAEI